MRVICVYKTGGDYDHRYVVALKFAVERFLNYKHTFHCLTNCPDLGDKVQPDVKIIPMRYDWPIWWSKMELFRPDLEHTGTTIYFDLDVLITKNILDFTRQCLFALRPLMLRSAVPIGIKYDWPSSSIMSWKGSVMRQVWDAWIESPELNMQTASEQIPAAGQMTDQGFIRHYVDPLFIQDLLPENYVLFKIDYLKNKYGDDDLLDKCSILNWTGKPRFHDMEGNLGHWEVFSQWMLRHEVLKRNYM